MKKKKKKKRKYWVWNMDKLNQYEKQSCKVIWFTLFLWRVLCSFNFSLKRRGVSLRLSYICGKKRNRWFCRMNLCRMLSLPALVLSRDFQSALKMLEELVFCKFWWVSISTGTSHPLHFYTLHAAGKWVSSVLNPVYSAVLSWGQQKNKHISVHAFTMSSHRQHSCR